MKVNNYKKEYLKCDELIRDEEDNEWGLNGWCYKR